MTSSRWRAVAVMAAVMLVVPISVGCTADPTTRKAPTALSLPRGLAEPVRPVDPVQRYADDKLSVMSLDEKIASMLMVHVPGLDAVAIGQFAAVNRVGGLILMGDNIPETAEQLAVMTPVMQGDPGLPVLIATDQEGGVVRRVQPDDALSALQLRALGPEAATAAFSSRAALLRGAGVTVNFGIVADVTGDPSSFLFERSLGSTAEAVSTRVAAAVSGERGAVLSTLKHFPGHGAAVGDSHREIPQTGMTLEQWRTEHAPPFAAGITAGAELVMFGHLQFDAVEEMPASLSPRWHEILRDELGFDAVTITDDMNMLEFSGRPEYAGQMQNAVLAVAAGNTMLLYVQQVDIAGVIAAVHVAVDAGRIPVTRIDQAARALLVMRRALSGETGRFVHCFEACRARSE